MTRDILLVDLSSIAHPIWHMAASDPDPNSASIKTVARVRALATGRPYVAICCDAGHNFRRELDPTYKANRPERNAALDHQIDSAIDTLKADGFPVWKCDTFEADDLAASAVRRVIEGDSETTVLLASADKDTARNIGTQL